MDIIVFESANEVIVGDAAHTNKLIKDYFLDGKRNLDDYNTYITNGGEGVTIETRISAHVMQVDNYDVTELMPNVLREALIEKGLLTDE